MQSLLKVTAIVLHFNRLHDTVQCLRSLAESQYPNLHILLLDSNLNDGLAEIVAKSFPHVQIVPLQENLGYAGNNNVGLSIAMAQNADWMFVQNDDTTLAPDCFELMLQAAEANPKVGIIGPMVYTFDEEKIISSAGGRVHWNIADAENMGMGQIDQGQYTARQVDFINGCGLLIRREAIEKAGLIDATFFMYYEETDWCQRVHKAGFEIWFEPAASMRHKAPIKWTDLSPRTLYYMTRNRIRFFARHTPLYLKPLALWRAFSGAMRGAWKHQQAGRKEHARATWMALQHAIQRRWGKAEETTWRVSLATASRYPAQPTAK